jgi:hypothetical protein
MKQSRQNKTISIIRLREMYGNLSSRSFSRYQTLRFYCIRWNYCTDEKLKTRRIGQWLHLQLYWKYNWTLLYAVQITMNGIEPYYKLKYIIELQEFFLHQQCIIVVYKKTRLTRKTVIYWTYPSTHNHRQGGQQHTKQDRACGQNITWFFFNILRKTKVLSCILWQKP